MLTKNNKFFIRNKIPGKIENTEKGMYRVYPIYTLECTTCGNIIQKQTHHLSDINNCECSICNQLEKVKSYINQTYGIFKVLSVNTITSNNKTTLLNVECIKCHTQSIKSITELHAARKYNRSLCTNCPDRYMGNTERASIDAPYNIIYGAYKRGAIDRNLSWELTHEEFNNLINQNCFYCNSEPKVYESEKRYNKTNIDFKRNGIDRIDSSKGYTIENCVPCCEMCNRMKLDYTLEEFKNQIERLFNNFVSKGSTTIENTEKSGSE